MTRRPTGIRPLNSTARVAYRVSGNPVISRPEDAVANCFPGLEIDVRNLDRRFFPGLVFDFVTSAGPQDPSPSRHFGAQLAYVDARGDPDLQTSAKSAQDLLQTLLANEITLGEGTWYLDWIKQGRTRISLNTVSSRDGMVVWRLVRSLEPGDLTIGLKRRDLTVSSGALRNIELRGWRRRYTDPDSGVISGAYQPGELMQGLCSPWQHDFRDCACFYWASNHPDVVYGEVYPGEPTLPSGSASDPVRANVRLDWLRANRSRALAASTNNTIEGNRPFQIDHLEINQAWQTLSVVLENTEIDARYTPADHRRAEPFHSVAEMARHLREELAPLEMTLAIEYLYAMFSLISDREAKELMQRSRRWPTLADDVAVARQHLMLIAVNEMQHLRWANQLLWELHRHAPIGPYAPVLRQATRVPAGDGRSRHHRLRQLTPAVLDGFVEIERPRGLIDGAYGRVIATLRQEDTDYPPHMAELAEKIASDGMLHESQFLQIRSALKTYYQAGPPYPYLRKIRLGTLNQTKEASLIFGRIVRNLTVAYTHIAAGTLTRSARYVAQARTAMDDLMAVGEDYAARGIGIRFRLPRK